MINLYSEDYRDNIYFVRIVFEIYELVFSYVLEICDYVYVYRVMLSYYLFRSKFII